LTANSWAGPAKIKSVHCSNHAGCPTAARRARDSGDAGGRSPSNLPRAARKRPGASNSVPALARRKNFTNPNRAVPIFLLPMVQQGPPLVLTSTSCAWAAITIEPKGLCRRRLPFGAARPSNRCPMLSPPWTAPTTQFQFPYEPWKSQAISGANPATETPSKPSRIKFSFSPPNRRPIGQRL